MVSIGLLFAHSLPDIEGGRKGTWRKNNEDIVKGFSMFRFQSKVPFYLVVITILITFYISSGIGLYLQEHNVNTRIGNLFDAYWLMTVFFLSGFEDFGPVTSGGRVLSLFMFLLGLGAVAAITGKIASVLVIRGQKEAKMPKEVSDHFAICNWNDGGDKIIKEIHAPQGEPETEIIVVTDKELNEVELRKSPEYEKVYFIKSDPTLHSVLMGSRVHLAKSVIILADNQCPDPDAKTALIALAITKLERGEVRKPHIVAEVINHRKIEHLRDAGVDEWICATNYGLGIIAQCAMHQKLSEVYQRLLHYSKETNEIYMVEGEKFPSVLNGMTFKEASRLLNDKREAINPVILLGVKRNDRIILNPRNEEFDQFKPDDALIVMAFDNPALSGIK